MNYALRTQVCELLESRKDVIFDLHSACAQLNEAGIRRPRGGGWDPNSLRYTLWNWGIKIKDLKPNKVEPRSCIEGQTTCVSNDDTTGRRSLTRVRVCAFLMTWHLGRRRDRQVLAELNHSARIYRQKKEAGDQGARLNVTYQQIAHGLNAAGIRTAGVRGRWTAEGFYNYRLRHSLSLDPVFDTEGLLLNEREPTFMQTLSFIDFAHIPTRPYADYDPHDEWPDDFPIHPDELLPHAPDLLRAHARV